jgi:hypothetical protein
MLALVLVDTQPSTSQGTAMIFDPEVNAILRAKIDKNSGTPAYKRVPVFVY